jgi:hypothetical protein
MAYMDDFHVKIVRAECGDDAGLLGAAVGFQRVTTMKPILATLYTVADNGTPRSVTIK